MRSPLLIAFLLLCLCAPANAFWQRSQWLACSEAPTEAERIRLNCFVFAPVYEWPVTGYRGDWPLPRQRRQRPGSWRG